MIFQKGLLQEDTAHLFGFSSDCVYSKTKPIDFYLNLREVAKNVKISTILLFRQLCGHLRNFLEKL